MKKTLKAGIKIYLFLGILITISLFSYSMYIVKTMNNSNPIILLLIGALFFFFCGFTYGNHSHKKGLLIGFLVGIIHLLIIKLIAFLVTGSFSFNILQFLIYVITSGIGGIIGVNIKKIF